MTFRICWPALGCHPCTLVFTVPTQAPPSVDDKGPQMVGRSLDPHLARRQGHNASPTGHGIPTWCGDAPCKPTNIDT